LIFIDLKRLNLEVYYFKTEKDYEVDFVVKNRLDLSLVQVAWDLNNPATRKREFKALRNAMQELKCPRGIIFVAEPMLSTEPLEEGIVVMEVYKYLMMEAPQQKQFLFEF